MRTPIPPLPDAGPTAASSPLSVKQAFRFAPTDQGHIDQLLVWAELPIGANVLDLGAGNGCVAARMRARRPDLSFCLVDQDRRALDAAGSTWHTHCADICNIPEPNGSFDALLCCYAMGYVPTADFFREAARVARRGAVVFIVDMVPLDGTLDSLSLFGYAIRGRTNVESHAASAGLKLDFYLEPTDDRSWGEAQFPGYFHILFGEVRPAIWRFTLP
ncbi:unnamed protein product (plasmid) [Mycetohabitans rhizoxinica HKI 454]|uniref:Methyltransferase domain-containing protein n=1 Tax=Mycetohabitans rhizoxinica (strain DSM 19002 / CIP 109453 / HKI 454) TaxID=882378 RepID=E5AUX1_MYCRK|nr:MULTISPECIES: class I SAM-dependent methyltransferase [Mycetohabitans]MCG1048381.1 methyltransferase domain-containing protein [Mycetohabitans sp. B6]CBW76895.1 unnamed protein product [Mycetohabitans rhizoxinica HKI 454]